MFGGNQKICQKAKEDVKFVIEYIHIYIHFEVMLFSEF